MDWRDETDSVTLDATALSVPDDDPIGKYLTKKIGYITTRLSQPDDQEPLR